MWRHPNQLETSALSFELSTIKVSHTQDEVPSSGDINRIRDRVSDFARGIKSDWSIKSSLLWLLEKF